MGLIRLLLALSVVIFHSAPLFGIGMMDGVVAVKGFFVISGFYMALILNEKYIKQNNSYKLFITNRLLRIYPAYWVMLLLTIVVGYFWAYHGASLQTLIPNNAHPKSFFLYASPLGILRDISLLFRVDYLSTNGLKLPIVAPAWTLIVELLFYFISPFLIKRKWWLLLLILIISFIIRYVFFFNHILSNEYLLTGFFPATVGYFMIGLFSYKLYERIKGKSISKKYSIAMLILCSGFILFWDKLPSILVFNLLLKDILFYPILYFSMPSLLLFTSGSIVDGFLADLSYPIYISHWFVFSLVWNVFSFKARTTLFVLLFLTGTLIFALLLKKLVDEPLYKVRQKRLK